tara:strand:+ start:75 stop:206 length:132 start_codon:yes stop_codon:yes gene_type:complete
MTKQATKADLYKAISKGMSMMSGTKAFKEHQKKIHMMMRQIND